MTTVLPVGDDEWPVVEWLWQAYAHDLSDFRGSLPRPDGRFQHRRLDAAHADGTAYLARVGDAPAGFSLVTTGENDAWHMMAFFVVRAARREGVGRELALTTIRQHPGPWETAFQEENPTAARFWRGLADTAFPAGWSEQRRPVPGKPALPFDVWILGG